MLNVKRVGKASGYDGPEARQERECSKRCGLEVVRKLRCGVVLFCSQSTEVPLGQYLGGFRDP